MLAHPTHERLIALGLPGMAKAFEDQRRSPDIAALSFEERIGLMVDREAAERDTKRLATRASKFAACYRRTPSSRMSTTTKTPRGLDRALFQKLVAGGLDRLHLAAADHRIRPASAAWIACALGHKACRDGRSVLCIEGAAAPRSQDLFARTCCSMFHLHAAC